MIYFALDIWDTAMDLSKPFTASSFLEDIEQYLVFPQVGFEVNRMAMDNRYSAIDIANEISKDPFVAAQVLRLANSVYYQFPSTVDTIPRAIAIIGTQDLCNLVLMLSMMGALKKEVGISSVSIDYIWQHSLFVGLLAREFSKYLPVPLYDTDRIFIAGVLHEIGRIIFSFKVPEQYDRMVKSVQDVKLPFYEIEKKYLGFAHNEVSGLLLKKWNFPHSLVDIITCQYKPSESKAHILEASLLLLANRYSEETGLGSIGIDEESSEVEIASNFCQLQEESLRKAIDESRRKYFALLPAFFQKRSA